MDGRKASGILLQKHTPVSFALLYIGDTDGVNWAATCNGDRMLLAPCLFSTHSVLLIY